MNFGSEPLDFLAKSYESACHLGRAVVDIVVGWLDTRFTELGDKGFMVFQFNRQAGELGSEGFDQVFERLPSQLSVAGGR